VGNGFDEVWIPSCRSQNPTPAGATMSQVKQQESLRRVCILLANKSHFDKSFALREPEQPRLACGALRRLADGGEVAVIALHNKNFHIW
jgi:hypothetical protein